MHNHDKNKNIKVNLRDQAILTEYKSCQKQYE
jgi:hypothetical protein